MSWDKIRRWLALDTADRVRSLEIRMAQKEGAAAAFKQLARDVERARK